jgi:hypothetical protein
LPSPRRWSCRAAETLLTGTNRLDGKIPALPPLSEQSRDRILNMLRALGP